MKTLLVVSCISIALAGGMMAWASPPTGVAPMVLSRGTYEPFKVKAEPDSPVDFQAKSKSELDIVVREHSYAPRASTGWHTHPGPVFITVVEGTLWFYEYDDATCTPMVVTAGEGYVDSGHGHIGINPSDDRSALDISVILAPPTGSFRNELPAPNPYCGF